MNLFWVKSANGTKINQFNLNLADVLEQAGISKYHLSDQFLLSAGFYNTLSFKLDVKF